MPIVYDQKTGVFRLDNSAASYAFRVNEWGYLEHLYYGARIPDTDIAYLGVVTSRHSRATFIEEGIPFSRTRSYDEYAGTDCGDYLDAAITVRQADGTYAIDPRYVSHRIYNGKPALADQPATFAGESEAQTLEVLCRDVTGVEITLYYTVFNDLAVITRHTVVKNASKQPVELLRVMSACVDMPDGVGMEFLHLYGDWGKERTVERAPIAHGTISVGSICGASSAAHNPFVAFLSKDATEERGEAYGFNLVYSGDWTAIAHPDVEQSVRLLMGVNPDRFCWRLEPDETFTAPEVVMVYSENGVGGMSRTYHKLYRRHLFRSSWLGKPRPILINNWEATRFDFTGEKLLAMAKEAASLGVDMFVLDDGWFGKRDNDHCALGDWYLNEQKLGMTFRKFGEELGKLGLKFGLWFEPEMVSPDSDLARSHPEWVLHIEGRPASVSRHQWVLDMSRADVRDYLFDSISKVLSSADICYFKWDYNRYLTEVHSALLPPERQGEVRHRYVLGLYDLLDRLTKAFPYILFEGCASGGGRFDPAMLYYSPQIWTSDDTDAVERLDIQYGTTICYPPSSMGAHVSEVPNQQVKRTTPIKMRAAVAMQGTFGYELDPAKFTDEEREAVREQCKEFRKYDALLRDGELYRLVNPRETEGKRAAWMFVSEDKKAAHLTYVVAHARVMERFAVRLAGLDPEKHYREQESGTVLSGATLMRAGWVFPKRLRDNDVRILYFEAID